MGCLLNIVVFLAFAIAASHAALLPEAYWKTVLPTTPMPKAVTNLLHPDYMQQKNTEVNVDQGGVHVDAGHGRRGGITVDVDAGHRRHGGTTVDVDAGHGRRGGTTVDVDAGHGRPGGTTVDVDAGHGRPGGTTVDVDAGHGRPGGTTVDVDAGHGRPGGTTVDVDAGHGKQGGGTSVDVGKGTGVNVNIGKPRGGINVNVGRKGARVSPGHPGENTNVGVDQKSVSVDVGYPGGKTNVGVGRGVSVDTRYPGGNTNVGAGRGGVSVDAGYPGGNTNVGVDKGDVSVNTRHKRRRVYVGVRPKRGVNPFNYQYAATQTQLHDDPNVALFFLEKDMHPGSQMNLHFIQDSNKATFLPRQEAKSIPFSSNKLPEILNEFSIQKGSNEAEVIKNTIKECEAPGIKGEDKYCATSLESMIDYTVSKLGKNIQAISTEVEKETKMQEYRISAQAKEMARDQAVVCHKQNWPYAVFYCHTTHTTKVYTIPLEGADGTKAKAVAVCHTNTAAWNPKHLAFQLLKVKPGTVPVCHFLPEDHIVWIPK